MVAPAELFLGGDEEAGARICGVLRKASAIAGDATELAPITQKPNKILTLLVLMAGVTHWHAAGFPRFLEK